MNITLKMYILNYWQKGKYTIWYLGGIFSYKRDIACCSVAQLGLTLGDTINCSMPSLPVPHHLPKFAQVHVHCIGDAIQPSLLWHPLLLLRSILPRIKDLSNESAVGIRWWKYWSFSFSFSPSNEYSRLISFRTDWFDLLAVQGTLKSLL